MIKVYLFVKPAIDPTKVQKTSIGKEPKNEYLSFLSKQNKLKDRMSSIWRFSQKNTDFLPPAKKSFCWYSSLKRPLFTFEELFYISFEFATKNSSISGRRGFCFPRVSYFCNRNLSASGIVGLRCHDGKKRKQRVASASNSAHTQFF